MAERRSYSTYRWFPSRHCLTALDTLSGNLIWRVLASIGSKPRDGSSLPQLRSRQARFRGIMAPPKFGCSRESISECTKIFARVSGSACQLEQLSGDSEEKHSGLFREAESEIIAPGGFVSAGGSAKRAYIGPRYCNPWFVAPIQLDRLPIPQEDPGARGGVDTIEGGVVSFVGLTIEL